MNSPLHAIEPETDWTQVRPLLDEVMHTLDAADREAVLLRHIEQRSYAEIGSQLGLSDNTARMRVERALEKLRAALSCRGVTSTTLALGAMLAQNALQAAPPHLDARIADKVLAGTAGASGVSHLVGRIPASPRTKVATALTGAAAVTLVAVALLHNRSTMFRNAATATNSTNIRIAATASVRQPPILAGSASAILQPTNGSVLHLKVVAADSGQPIPLVRVMEWQTGQRGAMKLTLQMVRGLRTDRAGDCDVYYLSNAPALDIALQADGFADTRLSWRREHGDVIPKKYRVRMDRAVPIGGRVVAPDGTPVAGAQVIWNGSADPATVERPEYHALLRQTGDSRWPYHADSIAAVTGVNGYWRIERVAADLLPRISGDAADTNFVMSDFVWPGNNPGAEKQLLAGTYVFRLKPAIVLTGSVVGPEGAPVSNAEVVVGNPSYPQAARGRPRGTANSPSAVVRRANYGWVLKPRGSPRRQ